MKKVLIAGLTATLLTGGAAASESEAVSKSLRGIQAALSACDIEKAQEFWSADATIFPPVETRLFKATEDMARWKEACARGERIKMDLGTQNISVHGDLAVVTALNSGTFKLPEGEAQTFTYRFTAVMKKVDGAWKGYHIHVSAPLAMPGNAEE